MRGHSHLRAFCALLAHLEVFDNFDHVCHLFSTLKVDMALFDHRFEFSI